MDIRDYTQHDATGLAELVQAQQVRADEVYAAALAAIDAVNPTINAFAQGPWDTPLDYAADGRFAGVPFALKDDPGCHAADIRYRYGSRLTGDGVAYPRDTFLMSRFRRSGLGAVGISAAPEFSLSPDTVTKIHGATTNPWDPTRSAGGSSGGSAALVASGAIPVAHGSDMGGSIRFPAGWNGVVGLKPSRGRVSPGPNRQDGAGFGLSSEFVLTRTVRDCAALLDIAAGPMPGDGVVLKEPMRPWVEEVGAAPGRLRIAVCADAYCGSTDPEVKSAVEATARRLEELGHDVEFEAPAVNWEEFIHAFTPMAGAGAYALISAMSALTGRTPGADTLEATTLAAYQYGTEVTVDQVLAFAGPVNAVSRAFGEFFVEWDLLVTPTAQVGPAPIGFLDIADVTGGFENWLHRMFEQLGSFTPLFNVTGGPAISLPLGWTAAGHPIGVQLATPMCDETTLFRVAAQLEEAMPWAARRPAVHAASSAR
jgi:amidase